MSGDKAGKSAYLNTTDNVIAMQQRWQNGTCARACAPLAVALPPFVELLRPCSMKMQDNVNIKILTALVVNVNKINNAMCHDHQSTS